VVKVHIHFTDPTLLTCQATLHPVNCPSALKLPIYGLPTIYSCLEFIPSLPRFLPILFYFVFSKIAHNQNFSEAKLSQRRAQCSPFFFYLMAFLTLREKLSS
jgi:hypothetical protein